MTICSTLSGKVAIKHPTLDVLVRDDGSIFNKTGNRKPPIYHWTFGALASATGYMVVTIKGKTYYVHRLVAEAFLPNPENKPTVDHWNRIRSDNRVSNLHWATYKEQAENTSQVENCKYGIRRCDDINAYDRAMYHANPEKFREKSRRSYKKRRQEHGDEVREKARERQRKWRSSKKQQKAAQ